MITNFDPFHFSTLQVELCSPSFYKPTYLILSLSHRLQPFFNKVLFVPHGKVYTWSFNQPIFLPANQNVTASVPDACQHCTQCRPFTAGPAPTWVQHSLCHCSLTLRECQSPFTKLRPAFCIRHALLQPHRLVIKCLVLF